MMTTTKLSISAAFIATAILSTSAFAHGRDRDGWHEHRHHHRHHQRMEYVPAQVVYAQPRVIYAAPPAVYRKRVVYQAAPVYYDRPVAYTSYNSNRLAGQAIGAVAGGVIGNQFGHGHIAPTAFGAVVGGILGGNLME
jgi:uncharacterized protein YcfJ